VAESNVLLNLNSVHHKGQHTGCMSPSWLQLPR